MKILKFFLVFLICVIIAAFAAHNASYVPLNFYPFGVQISVAAFFLIFICILVGVLLSGIISVVRFVYYRRIIKAKDRQIRDLEKQVLSLVKPADDVAPKRLI